MATPMGTTARIYRPAPSPMQSGRGNCIWILEFEPACKQMPDPLMGWEGQGDVERQVTLRFASCEAAIRYARDNALDCAVIGEQKPTLKRQAYADNFRCDRPPSVYPH
jgi:hypothetical protein